MSVDIDRINGPHDGVVELVVVVQQDWDSDPFLVMNLREKFLSYQEYLMGEQFRASFAGCRGVIILETRYFPPEEVQRILAKEGVEVRVSSDISPAPVAPAPQAMAAPAPQAMAAPAPQAMAAPAPQAMAAPAPQAMAAPAPATIPQPVAAFQPAPTPHRDPWEVDEDDDFLPSSSGGGSSASAFAALGVAVLFVGVMIYGLMGLMSTPKDTSPSAVLPKTVSAKTLPKESHASLSVTPDRRAFVVVPIQDRAGKEQVKYHLLFGVKETPRLLVFATFEQSKVPVRVEYKTDPNDPSSKEAKVVWGKFKKLQSQSYTGRLEALQRYTNGPLELVLPGGNRDVNKLYRRLSKKLPLDSMILVVGAKPRGPSQPYGVFLLVGLLGVLASGGVFLALRSRAARSF